MAAIQDLKSVLKETLENRGTLDQIKARVRAEVFHTLNDPSEARPPMSNENMLINELILEYLEYNSYRYTASVLTAESSQPTPRLDRQFITNELNLIENQDTASMPLLYGILTHFTHGKQRRSQIKSRVKDLSRGERSSKTDQDGFEGSHEAPVLLRGEKR